MAYLYRHVRVDKGEVFYIGIGSSEDGKYLRANSRKGRSLFWKSIADKSNYKVDILMNNLTWNDACVKEVEFIALYGRRDLNLGTLVNLTNGGDGVVGYKHSAERLKQISETSKMQGRSCVNFDTGDKFESLLDACESLGLNYGSIASAVRRRNSTAQFYFEDDPFIRVTRKDVSESLGSYRTGNKNSLSIPVIHVESNVEFASLTEACRHFNLKYITERARMVNDRDNKKFTLKQNKNEELKLQRPL